MWIEKQKKEKKKLRMPSAHSLNSHSKENSRILWFAFLGVGRGCWLVSCKNSNLGLSQTQNAWVFSLRYRPQSSTAFCAWSLDATIAQGRRSVKWELKEEETTFTSDPSHLPWGHHQNWHEPEYKALRSPTADFQVKHYSFCRIKLFIELHITFHLYCHEVFFS